MPRPFLSSLNTSCLASGKDLVQGGAKYNIGPVLTGIGLAVTANSLAAIKQLSVKVITGIVAGFMSFFSSTIGVVAPTLIPMVPNISTSTGVGATALISTIMIAGHFAGVSPFSTGGAMTLAGETNEAKRDKLFIHLMALSLCSIAFASLLIVLGVIR